MSYIWLGYAAVALGSGTIGALIMKELADSKIVEAFRKGLEKGKEKAPSVAADEVGSRRALFNYHQ